METVSHRVTDNLQHITQCKRCCRDAVPRAVITFQGDVFCFSCFDPHIHGQDGWVDVESENTETVEFALSLYAT